MRGVSGEPAGMSRVPAVNLSPGAIASADIAAAAQLACLLEVTAPKPGNVSPGRGFDDLAYEHFLASAAAIGGPLSGAGTRPLGATVRLAIEATARWTSSNTNLGIVLLLAPLARAAHALPVTGVRLLRNSAFSRLFLRRMPREPSRGPVKADTTEDARQAVRIESRTRRPERSAECSTPARLPTSRSVRRSDKCD
jgi:triphosphoribosyl-dephospho-CoA synthetase